MPNTSFSIVDTIVCFQEKTKLEETVKKLEAEITSLKAAMKKMQCEKDEFAGHNIALKEEVEIYKVGYYLTLSLYFVICHDQLLPFVHEKMTIFTMSSL